MNCDHIEILNHYKILQIQRSNGHSRNGVSKKTIIFVVIIMLNNSRGVLLMAFDLQGVDREHPDKKI